MNNLGWALYHCAGQRAQPLQGDALALPLLGLALQLRPARARVGIGDSLLTRRARTALGTAPQCTRRNDPPSNSLHGGV
jgi:hypothetical protein